MIQFANAIQVNAATSLTLRAANGEIDALGSVTLNAADGISVDDALEANGDVTIEADSNGSTSSGVLTLSAGLVSNNHLIDISADEIVIGAAIDSGSANTSITESDGVGMGIGDTAFGLHLDATELASFVAADLELISSGDFVVDDGVQSTSVSGSTIIRSGGTVSFSNQASTFRALVVEAENGIDIGFDVTTTVGDFSLDGDSDNATDSIDQVSISAGVALTSAGQLVLAATTQGITSDADLDLVANDGVTIADHLNSTGVLTINSDADAGDNDGTFQIDSGAQVTSTANTILVTANDVNWIGSIGGGGTDLTLNDFRFGWNRVGRDFGRRRHQFDRCRVTKPCGFQPESFDWRSDHGRFDLGSEQQQRLRYRSIDEFRNDHVFRPDLRSFNALSRTSRRWDSNRRKPPIGFRKSDTRWGHEQFCRRDRYDSICRRSATRIGEFASN